MGDCKFRVVRRVVVPLLAALVAAGILPSPALAQGASRTEDFTAESIWVRQFKASDHNNCSDPTWSKNEGLLFVNATAGCTGGSTRFDMVIYPAASTVTVLGYARPIGRECEIYKTDYAPGIEVINYYGRFSDSAPVVTFTNLTPGEPLVVSVSAFESAGNLAQICGFSSIGPVYDPAEMPSDSSLTELGTGTPWVQDDYCPEGGTSCYSAGDLAPDARTISECVPKGWNLLNPFAFIGGIGCALSWAFVPDWDTFSTTAAGKWASLETKAPISWGVAVTDGMVELFSWDSTSGCWIDLPTFPGGQAVGFNASPGTCPSDGAYGGFRPATIMAALIWIGVAWRIWHSAPWHKGVDSGMPG